MPLDSTLEKKRLRFRSWHRGCKETDLMLGYFCEQHLDSLTAAERSAFAIILDEQDADLLDWLTGKIPLPAHLAANPVMQRLMTFDVTPYLPEMGARGR